MPKLINIVTPCFNEAENVKELYARICAAIEPLAKYEFEFLFIDNASTDGTVAILKEIAASDQRVKIIVNTRNFGHVRSPYWGILQSRGDATIYMASDLQDPPEQIPTFISEWEKGWKVALATKPDSRTGLLTHALRRIYYRVLDDISSVSLVRDATGFGLYDKVVLDHIRAIGDPYPYFRGLICELGFPIKTIPFDQPRRARGISKSNFYGLYDVAMLGIVSHSLVPLRFAAMFGFVIAGLSFLAAFGYFVVKLLYWDSFPVGIAPLIISLFFLFGLLFLFLGILGEYVGSIQNYVKNRPIVVEKERINLP